MPCAGWPGKIVKNLHPGLASAWDYGPLGVELKRNIKDRWWGAMVHQRDDIEGLDAAILMHPRVWEASGHVEGFTDPLVECGNCHRRFRADIPEVEGGQCPVCGTKDTFSDPIIAAYLNKHYIPVKFNAES